MIRVGALSVDIKQTSNSKHTSDADIRQDTMQHAAGPHTTMHTEAHHVPRLGASPFSHCVYCYAPKLKILPDSALPSSL